MKRVALITGASGYLGTSFINRFAHTYEIIAVHNGNLVQFATQDQTFVDPLAVERTIDKNRDGVWSFRADLSQPKEIDRLIAFISNSIGRVDLVVNAAALRPWSHLLSSGALDTAEAQLNVNILAPLRLSVGLAHQLWMTSVDDNVLWNRNIINVSSSAGLWVYPDTGQALYAASKAALNHLTYHMASEFWDIGIRVNAVAPDTFPGRVSTEAVLHTIIELDSTSTTGQVVPLRMCE